MSVNSKMTAIADAIRAKTGGTDALTLDQMATEIAGIEAGIDTSDATAAAENIQSGYTAYVNGEKVTGAIPIASGGITGYDVMPSDDTGGMPYYYAQHQFTEKTIIDPNRGSMARLYMPKSAFGDATAEDVAEGKTFTSAAGLLVTGTKVETESSDSHYDTFWDAFQQNGERTDYLMGFSGPGWTNETFAPKYPMAPVGSVMQMFANSGLTDFDFVEKGIELDFSLATSVTYLFQSCTGITRLGVLDFTGCTNLNRPFYGCKVVTIDNFIVDEANTYTSVFDYAYKLENITVSGTIGASGLNFKYSPLSKDSIVSIIGALSTTTSGLSITLPNSAVNTAFETSDGAADGSSSDEWTVLVATKSNWTISLA